MSWSFHMAVNVGSLVDARLEDFEASYTYNVGPMFKAAFNEFTDEGIQYLNGREGEASIGILSWAIQYMRNHQNELKKLNPANGWGDYEGALALLEQLLQWTVDAPKARFVVS